jgi:two-component system invasion response regulator UvrY
MNEALRPIRVMLVDDHALVRMGFRMLLADANIEVAAEADTGEQACQDYPQVRPDLVVMDLSMPGMGGLEAVRRLLAHDPKARVLALSAHEDSVHPQRVMRAGALGYLAKRSAPDALIATARTAASTTSTPPPRRRWPWRRSTARATRPSCSASASSRCSCSWPVA